MTRSVLGEKPLGMDMTLVSLFAGVGGFDLGFEHAGFETIGQCEIDPHAVSVLERHWPTVPKHDDVTTLTVSTFGPADVVTFGSPCQDLSVAGKRAGLDGERSGLFLEAVRYIREMLEETNGRYPRWAVLENVPGAFSSNGGEDFTAVLESLVGGTIRNPTDGWSTAGVAFGPAGSAEWRTLDSQHFGVPQRRRRIFLIYRPRGERAGEILFEPSSLRGNPKPRSSEGETAAPHGPSGVREPIAFRWKSAAGAGLSEGPTSPPLEATPPTHAVATGGAVRRFTALEEERLQGFPDDCTRYAADGTEIADTHRYRMMGNAVSVPVAEWIAQRLKRAIS